MSNQPRPKVVSGAKPEVGHYEDFMAHAFKRDGDSAAETTETDDENGFSEVARKRRADVCCCCSH